MTMSTEGQNPSLSRKLPAKVPLWSSADYAGTYSSSELGVTWSIGYSGSNLAIRQRNAEHTLSPLDKDEVTGGPGFVHFLRDGHGQVVAFTVTNVRDTGIEFRRSAN